MSAAIRALANECKDMAEVLDKHKPDCDTIVIYRADRDLLMRLQDDAELAGFKFNEGEPYWGKYRLRVDKGVPR